VEKVSVLLWPERNKVKIDKYCIGKKINKKQIKFMAKVID